jgi:hypothetical protein|tara:strand:+ start:194 stop:754 length:561 start_codon:yes stop_codon:yes gene_type:complete
LTTKYDDLILKNTSNWRSTSDITRKVGGDKSAIIQACERLVEMDYLQTNPNKNKIMYKRKDTLQSEFNFLLMMDKFEMNQKTEMNRLKQIPTLMMTDGKRFRSKGIELLEHILEEVDRAYRVKIRLDYQKNESLISSEIANDRIKKLDKYIEKIMNEVMNKHEEENTIKAIREYFQNHATKFELKI